MQSVSPRRRNKTASDRVLSSGQDGGDEVRTVPGWSTLSRAEGALERLSIPVAEGCRLIFRVDKGQAEILDLDWLDGRYGGGDDGDGRHKA